MWCRGRWEEKPNGGGKTKEEKNIERAWQQNSFTGEGLCYEYYREGFLHRQVSVHVSLTSRFSIFPVQMKCFYVFSLMKNIIKKC